MCRDKTNTFPSKINSFLENGDDYGWSRSVFLSQINILGNITRTKVGRETAITWKFAQLDKNKNRVSLFSLNHIIQVIERSEWKPYKAILLQWKRVRRCSRNLFKTCDTDKNKRLTPGEWKQCLAPGGISPLTKLNFAFRN